MKVQDSRRDPRRLLMVAFQFPPFGQSTGGVRVVSFARDLPQYGWQPIMLTAREHAYPEGGTTKTVPPELRVYRAAGRDIARIASIRGAYPRLLATPDRWNTWAIGSVITGLRAIRETRPDAIWCTFPIPSALIAGLALARISGIPLVVDLRDPIVYESWPSSVWDRRIYRRLELCATRIASAIVTTTPGARSMYQERYPAISGKFHVVANGIEDQAGSAATFEPDTRPEDNDSIVLLHSGLMEMPDRDPTALFAALRLLRQSGDAQAGRLQIVLRGSNNDARFSALARAAGVEGMVRILPRVERSEALRETARASALLVFQGRHCNRQIPAKAYECLAAGKPIVALVDPGGDTHRLIADEWRVPYCADMEQPERIAAVLRSYLADRAAGSVYTPPSSLHAGYTRRAQARKLADLLDDIVEPKRGE